MHRSRFHPWHDIAPGPSVPDVLTAVIEIPRHSRNKYEIDKDTGMFRLDRVLHSAVHYPGDYGFIPQTLGDDGDPLDIVLMMTAPVFPGCLVDVRPVGIFHLVDRGDSDEKIIAVPTRDPFTDEIRDIKDIRSHALLELEHFFQVYKDLENVRVETRGFDNAKAAKKVILAAVANYKRKFTAR
ncbi:MAG TPA: inorganic diphosphatase, partial [Gemmatimonadales bacterium]|nr:inorganic diphosphatase [Gemmatimonadales bacterium]